MNPELQTVVDRLELAERQNRGWKTMTMAALALAVVALALPLLRGNQPKSDRAKFSVVEANRFLLRDVHGAVVGGLESTPDGTLRLVLGQRGGASAHIVVQPHESQLTLNAPDGQWRAVLAGSNQPSLSLSPDGRAANAALLTRDDGTGSVLLRDALGRPRFRAP
jgi:hypothetical protein